MKRKFKIIFANPQRDIMKLLYNIIRTLSLFLLCIISMRANAEKNTRLSLRTVVIDAGHGGKDPGCIYGGKKRLMEKDLTLDISTRLAQKIKAVHPEVKVIMTRSDDTFIEVKERAEIANRNNADLFISIHINSVETKGRAWAPASGFSIHCLGQSRTGRDLFSFNMEVCMRENSVILLENDHSTSYQGFDPNDPESYIFFNLMQNSNLVQSLVFAEFADKELLKGPLRSRGISQDPFLVLWKTKMPAVLVECGFITNENDHSKLRDPMERDRIASGLAAAFGKFKKSYDASLGKSSQTQNSSSKEKEKIVIGASDNEEDMQNIYYGVQVLAMQREIQGDDKFFKGYDVMVVFDGSLFKYIVSPTENKKENEENFNEIKKDFSGSFKVMVKNNKVSRITQ